jgi:hypothetical protein
MLQNKEFNTKKLRNEDQKDSAELPLRHGWYLLFNDVYRKITVQQSLKHSDRQSRLLPLSIRPVLRLFVP